jgi:hypothetical protein
MSTAARANCACKAHDGYMCSIQVPRQACTTRHFSSTPVFQNVMAWQSMHVVFPEDTSRAVFAEDTIAKNGQVGEEDSSMSLHVKRREETTGGGRAKEAPKLQHVYITYMFYDTWPMSVWLQRPRGPVGC